MMSGNEIDRENKEVEDHKKKKDRELLDKMNEEQETEEISLNEGE